MGKKKKRRGEKIHAQIPGAEVREYSPQCINRHDSERLHGQVNTMVALECVVALEFVRTITLERSKTLRTCITGWKGCVAPSGSCPSTRSFSSSFKVHWS
jgi:hypothetical protein